MDTRTREVVRQTIPGTGEELLAHRERRREMRTPSQLLTRLDNAAKASHGKAKIQISRSVGREMRNAIEMLAWLEVYMQGGMPESDEGRRFVERFVAAREEAVANG